MASSSFLEDPLGQPLIPSWSRVAAALPDFLDALLEAVERDTHDRVLQAA